MKNHLLIIMSFFILTACKNEKNFDGKSYSKTINHPYIVDSIINSPIKFQPEEISTQIDKFNTSFSPDGKTVYYTATHQKLGLTGITFQRYINGRFSNPEFVPFVPFAYLKIISLKIL